MSSSETHARLDLWGRWVVATTLGWVVGVLAAFPLSYFVVNLVYPKETNLIVGLCLGAAVGVSQAIAVRPRITLGRGWVWGATAGLGIPFVLAVVVDELRSGGVDTPTPGCFRRS
jgi:hypothetical protein